MLLDLIDLAEALRQVPDCRVYIGAHPLHALLAITAAAYLAGAPRGQLDLAAFARRLSSSQRQALGVIRLRSKYSVPGQLIFSRRFTRVQAACIKRVLLAHQCRVRGESSANEIVVIPMGFFLAMGTDGAEGFRERVLADCEDAG